MRRPGQQRLSVIPLTRDVANAFVEAHHRHHPRVQGCRFSIGVVDEAGTLRGVAIVGRPKARALDDGRTAEVVRLATDGCPNACSKLYAAARRAWAAMGGRKVITYTDEAEPGDSLIAAGWGRVAFVKGRSWDCPSRPRDEKQPATDKWRWEVAV